MLHKEVPSVDSFDDIFTEKKIFFYLPGFSTQQDLLPRQVMAIKYILYYWYKQGYNNQQNGKEKKGTTAGAEASTGAEAEAAAQAKAGGSVGGKKKPTKKSLFLFRGDFFIFFS